MFYLNQLIKFFLDITLAFRANTKLLTSLHYYPFCDQLKHVEHWSERIRRVINTKLIFTHFRNNRY